MVILSDKVPVSTRILKKWMAPAWSVQYSSSTEALPPNDCIQNCPPPVMSWFTLLSILFPQAFLLDINFSTLLFTSLFSFVVVVVFLQLDSIYFTFYLCLSHSTLSLRFSISSGSSSISLLQQHFYPSITHLSKSTATDACRHAKEKTHFLSYCHVSEI